MMTDALLAVLAGIGAIVCLLGALVVLTALAMTIIDRVRGRR